MPGPLFNISAFIGAIAAMRAGWNAVVGIICAWVGLFAPGILCKTISVVIYIVLLA
jgi:chromate transporter